MSDTARMYDLLREAGPRGIHTFDLRRLGVSGNPSQRATDIEERYGVTVDREWERRGDRRGKRFTLTNVGVESEGCLRQPVAGESQTAVTLDPGVEHSASQAPPRPGASSAPPAVRNPYEYEVWAA